MRRAAHALAAAAVLALWLGPAPAASSEPFDAALYADVLARFTREVPDPAGTRVDYSGLARAPEWPRLLANLAGTRPAALSSRAARLAYWINAYNILAIDLVVKHQPVDSIRDIGSLLWPVWRREAGRIDGRAYTLHEIEHEILRPMGDPRIHAALVCASVSCPALRREPWTAERLDAQFDDTLRRWLADRDKGLAIDRAALVVRLSRIFDWFEDDFGGRAGVLSFVAAHVAPPERDWLEAHGADARIVYFDYDWRLNGLSDAPGGG